MRFPRGLTSLPTSYSGSDPLNSCIDHTDDQGVGGIAKLLHHTTLALSCRRPQTQKGNGRKTSTIRTMPPLPSLPSPLLKLFALHLPLPSEMFSCATAGIKLPIVVDACICCISKRQCVFQEVDFC